MSDTMGDAKTVKRYDSPEQLYRGAAEAVLAACRAAVEQRGRCLLALAGGSTPRGLYERLARSAAPGEFDWTQVHFLWGDERSVPPTDEQSNYRLAETCLLKPLGIAAENVHRLQGELENLDDAARQYERTLRQWSDPLAPEAPPRLDLVLLGMGGDGHTASLFPHTQALHETSRWVVINEVPQLRTRRLTMTLPLLNRARRLLLLVAGVDKAETLASVLQGPRRPLDLPSQLLAPQRGVVEWHVDRAAASSLRLDDDFDSLDRGMA